jgi:hypothetical protein
VSVQAHFALAAEKFKLSQKAERTEPVAAAFAALAVRAIGRRAPPAISLER